MPFYLQFEQVDVFAERPHEGNALAVVVGADELTTEQMQAFARWTQLSETTFLLRPEAPEAHYRVHIFTPLRELPFAGHPTLGSCEVWLKQQGNREHVEIIQECSAGLTRVRKQGSLFGFLSSTAAAQRPVGREDAESDRAGARSCCGTDLG